MPTRQVAPATDHPVTDPGTGIDGTGAAEVAARWELPHPTLQRADDGGGEVTAAAEPEPPTATGVATALGGAAPAVAQPGGPDLDELARRLYGPMSALLRAELWLDRERSGRSLAR